MSRCSHFEKSYRTVKSKSYGYHKIYGMFKKKYGYPITIESGLSYKYCKWKDNRHNNNWKIRELTGKSNAWYLKYNGDFIRYPRKCVIHPFAKEGEKGLW
jgi:hypothetical protein